MQHDFDNKESLAKADQEKKDALTQEQMKKDKLVRDGFIFGSILYFEAVVSNRESLQNEVQQPPCP